MPCTSHNISTRNPRRYHSRPSTTAPAAAATSTANVSPRPPPPVPFHFHTSVVVEKSTCVRASYAVCGECARALAAAATTECVCVCVCCDVCACSWRARACVCVCVRAPRHGPASVWVRACACLSLAPNLLGRTKSRYSTRIRDYTAPRTTVP